MDIAAAFMLMAVLAACSIGPGLVVLPWLQVDDDETVVVVVAVSLLAVFLAAFGIYLTKLPVGCHWALTAGCAACIGCRWKTFLRLAADPSVRVQAAGLCLVLAHALLLQASVRSYNGLLWLGDWLEHFERTRFFIDRPDPSSTRFLSLFLGPDRSYALTARPPLMNVLTAHAIACGTPTFAAFQVASTWLNALACLPAMALAGRWAPSFRVTREHGMIAAAAALTVLPSFTENATFTWTKLLAAFYVSASILLIARSNAAASPTRLALAGMLLGAGVAVHYSSAVYSVVLGLAIVVAAAFVPPAGGHDSWPSRLARACKAGVWFGLPQVLVLLPWLLFSLATFGLRGTLATNTAVTDVVGMTLTENLRKIGLNCFETLVPHFLRERPPLIVKFMAQPNRSAVLRDWWFAPLQVNFPMAVGTVTQFVAAGIGVRSLAMTSSSPASRRSLVFWCWIFVAGCLLGIAVVGSRDTLGQAHICLQPLILVTVVACATALPGLPSPVRLLALAGLAWDYLVGVMLQFWLEHLPLEAVFTTRPDGTKGISGRLFGMPAAGENAALKQAADVVFLGDLWPDATVQCWWCGVFVGLIAWTVLATSAFRRQPTPASAADGPIPSG